MKKTNKNDLLAAMAPQLLDAIKQMTDEFRQYDHTNSEGSSFEKERLRLIRLGTKLIRKAKGE